MTTLFDSLIADLFTDSPAAKGSQAPGLRLTRRGSIPTDIVRTDDEARLVLDLPGIDPASLDVTVDDDHVTVTADRIAADEGTVVRRERPTGQIRRRFNIGRHLDTSRISADYTHGVLTLTIAVAEEAKPRRIDVDGIVDSIGSDVAETPSSDELAA